MKSQIPLFPLGMVLLPGNALPLHIFEARYKELVDECMKESTEFGVTWYNGTTMRRYGCTARIMGILHQYDDGSSDILASGNRRFRLDSLVEGKNYLQADIHFFEDKKEDHLALHESSLNLIDALEELSTIADMPFDREGLSRLSPGSMSFVLANTNLMNIEERQEALEDDSAMSRLKHLGNAAYAALERAKSTHRIQRILGREHDISHMLN